MGVLKKGYEAVKSNAKEVITKEIDGFKSKAIKTIKDNIVKEATSMKSSMYGAKKPLLPKRKVSFVIKPVDDKPHFINK